MQYKEIDIITNYERDGAAWDGTKPRLYGYLLDKSEELKMSGKRPAVIVCPGGAYRFLSDREGEPIAMKFLAEGMQAFVLRYSTSPSRFPCALLELAESVRIVRENSEEWGILPDKIIICGFSAGGHLCGCLGTMWNDGLVAKGLGAEIADAVAWRPNGMILCYPVISMGEYTHLESRELLLGPQAEEEEWQKLSLENRVTEQTVPVFLWHTYEDEAVPAENSLLFSVELRKYKVPFELHLYQLGEHGLALCNDVTENLNSQVVPDNEGWVKLAVSWIKRNNFR